MNAATVRTHFAAINNKKIAYRRIGNGDPMILCQRFRGNLDDWDPGFLDELGRHYEVYIFDPTGMGSSEGTVNSDMMGFARDVIDLADALQIDQFLLGGWSFGGMVAQIVTTEFSSRVHQTILMGTKPPGQVNHPIEEIFLQTAYIEDYTFEHEVILFFEPISERSRTLAKASHDRINSRTIDRDTKVKPPLWEYYGKGVADFVKDPYNCRQKLQETTIPILVISGDHEVCFPPENWFDLNRALPTTQVVVIPRAGHGPHHQYPAMAASYIHAFIENNKNK
ncbi:alpha/beta hydrolase [Paraflavitalea sp. CAU 1676]|uniref:alpha/beta fold hydrolase n=1 Tax=Paraflavitalea sp. CAU 1676 TaxID=3032598 RepID=UPI0023D9EFF7|nr:alpha/beta hydrolase [Paraflavitalea sp. CAU 1676]MDF2191672.1 alpha/beta hydrolase [Paraflavitalea sp. CAU 1676]